MGKRNRLLHFCEWGDSGTATLTSAEPVKDPVIQPEKLAPMPGNPKNRRVSLIPTVGIDRGAFL